MIEENNLDDFEQFLQEDANNHKMFPSDRVWNNIAEEIQPKKSWPALTIITSLILLSLGVATFLNYPPENPFSKIHFNSSKNSFAVNPNNKLLKTEIKNDLQNNNLTIVKAKNTLNRIEGIKIAETNNTASIGFDELVNDLSNKKTASDSKSSTGIAINKSFEKGILAPIDDYSSLDYPNPITDKLSSLNVSKNRKHGQGNSELKDRLAYEVYTTPSISFRSLVEDKVINQLASSSSSVVNSQVNQKAGLGSEIGVGLRYKVSKDFTFKSGLQFNIRQYYIDANTTPGQATIEVLQDNKFDSISVSSKYGNGKSSTQTILNNRLYQVSLPIGFEWNVLNHKNLGLSLSASIQPTYSLNKNVYILSTDYKYYTNGESLFRKWNVNSAIGANLTYKLKKSTLYFGPQVRYQHLPTYVDKYPIKEYRIDYGMWIGIIKTIK